MSATRAPPAQQRRPPLRLVPGLSKDAASHGGGAGPSSDRLRTGLALASAVASLAVFTAAHAQTRIPVPIPPDGPINGQSQVQTSGAPRAPLDPAAAAAVANSSAFPGIPPTTPPIYLRRPSPLCSDFQPVANGGWAALGPIQFPGPQGPVQMVVGQTVVPGDYLDGMDLGSLLQRDCPRRPAP